MSTVADQDIPLKEFLWMIEDFCCDSPPDSITVTGRIAGRMVQPLRRPTEKISQISLKVWMNSYLSYYEKEQGILH